MKKINLLLIFIAIVGSIFITFKKDNNIVFILKDLSIILTINAIYILMKIFKFKIDEGIIFIYVMFIFLAHFLGVTCELYNKIYWYDKFTHFLSGIISGLGAIYLFIKFSDKKNKNIVFNTLFIIAFSLMIASLWEIFEYVSSILFNVDPQKVATTGVNDTMGDIIVAFLGSIIVSLMYKYEIKNNNNLLIKKFINVLK